MRLLRGLAGEVLTCGCLAGVYETYEGRVVVTIDARGASIADVCFDHRQVDPELGPRVVIEAAASHVLDPPDFEVGDVGAMMDDAHQVGFSKADPYRVTGDAVRREIAFQEAREIT